MYRGMHTNWTSIVQAEPDRFASRSILKPERTPGCRKEFIVDDAIIVVATGIGFS